MNNKIMNQPKVWSEFYSDKNHRISRSYPSEWVVRTLAGGRYPNLKMDKEKYTGGKILDLGCGDGRNISLLLDLEFDVHACEISSNIVDELCAKAKSRNWPVTFSIGKNSKIAYPEKYFDYLLSSASCYYLEKNVQWSDVRSELARVICHNGLLIANIPDNNNYILKNAHRLSDDSYVIKEDPYGLRDGTRFAVVHSAEELKKMLEPEFSVISVGYQSDDFYGINVSCYWFVAQKISNY